MRRWITLASIAVAAVAVVRAQPRTTGVPLAGADYVEIKNAYGRSLHAMAVGGGTAFAQSFTPDGELIAPDRSVSSRAALARDADTRQGARHSVTNLFIEATPEGALAWPYVLESRGQAYTGGVLYRDRWIKTREGWRIRTREELPGNQMPPRIHRPAASNDGQTGFTPRDYFEIENLLTRYNLGWDNGRMFDAGLLCSLSFTRDALFERPGGDTRRGREGIFDQVKANGSPKGGLHHWDTNLLIDLDPAGHVGSLGYDLLLNVDETGSPVAVNSTGTLEHRIVRTAEGWLMNYRIYKSIGAVPKISWPAPPFQLEAREITSERGAAVTSLKGISAADYVEIDQLYIRSNIAFDGALEGGAAFARMFTPDGTWTRGGVTTSGTPALTALAGANTTGLETWTSNLTLEPTKDSVTGRVYVLMKDGQNPKTSIADLGTFEDVLVKTPEGWRFKKRMYTSEARGR